jgi:tetratricopeptide (TPR) repeat protein
VTPTQEAWYDVPERERYDLVRDPDQRQNLYRPEDAERAAALFDAFDWNWPPESAHSIDAATQAQLEALGYVVDPGATLVSKIDPKSRIELYDLLTVNRHSETPERALASARKLEKEYGLLPALARFEVGLLDAIGRGADAITVLERAIVANPGSVQLTKQLETRREARQRKRELAAAIRDTLAKNPAHPSARRDLALTLHQLQDLADAEVLYREVLADEPGQTEIRLNLARLLVSRGEYAASLDVLESAPGSGSSDPRFDCQIGRLLGWYLDRREEAREAMSRCAATGIHLGEMDRALLDVRGARVVGAGEGNHGTSL